MNLREYAGERTNELLARLGREVANVSQRTDAEAIHDLRVSIRRYTQALRALRSMYARSDVKRIRRRLRSMMDLAAEIRNRDIVLELMDKAKISPESPIYQHMAEERDIARGDLVLLARQWKRRNVTANWHPRERGA